MNINAKRDFLINIAYWAVIATALYLFFEYLLPICVPFIIGILVAWMVVSISKALHCNHKLLRIGLILLVYGLAGVLVGLVAVKGISTISNIVKWLPEFYELKLLPLATMCYNHIAETIAVLDPALINALQKILDGILSSMQSVISSLSGYAVNLISGVATGVPSVILSLLAMIFSSVFVANDFEQIKEFTGAHLPLKIKSILGRFWIYLRDTLFVVIRSYALIMLLTFTELSLLFSIFDIENAFLKAAVIAFLDILPILGTGGIMIPWAVISLVLGYTTLGIELFIIYAIVTVIRNYVEPKIVGAQLGLHPIITLVSMFLGLRLFGFFGLFGLPVAISFLWKQKKAKEAETTASTEATE